VDDFFPSNSNSYSTEGFWSNCVRLFAYSRRLESKAILSSHLKTNCDVDFKTVQKHTFKKFEMSYGKTSRNSFYEKDANNGLEAMNRPSNS